MRDLADGQAHRGALRRPRRQRREQGDRPTRSRTPAPGRRRACSRSRVPVDAQNVDNVLFGKGPKFVKYVGNDKLESLGNALGTEFAAGGQTPLWKALGRQLIGERDGNARQPRRRCRRRRGPRSRSRATRCASCAASTRASRRQASRSSASRTANTKLSAREGLPARAASPRVDDIDEMTGRAALALLLAGAQLGHLRHRRRTRTRILPDAAEWLTRCTILVAARDEEERIARDRRGAAAARFPDAEVIVADDGSRDATAERAEAAGAIVLRLPRRGKGQALSAAERAAPPGALLLVDADLRGDLAPLLPSDKVSQGLRIAAFADAAGRRLRDREAHGPRADPPAHRLRRAREPLSGQRALSAHARAAVFPLAPGFGAETRMTIDAVRAGESRRGGRAAARAPRDRARRARLRPPRPPARSTRCSPPGPLRVELPRCAPAARRLDRRAARAARHRDRPRGRPLERARARLRARTCARGARPAC